MDKILNTLQRWLHTLFATNRPHDPLAGLTQRELADLPATHPLRDDPC